MNRYLVWDEDESREDARKIEEMYPECAATRWAEKDDNESAEYDIANGDKVGSSCSSSRRQTRTDSENLDRIRAALTVEVVTQDLAERRHALLRSILSRPWPVDSFGEITSQSFQQMDRELIAVGLRIERDEFGRPRYDRDNNRLNIEEVGLLFSH